MTDLLQGSAKACTQCSGPAICRAWNLTNEHQVEHNSGEPVKHLNVLSSKPVVASTYERGSFPFMNLPLELRCLVYDELLVMPWPITIFGPTHTWYRRPKQKHQTYVKQGEWLHEYCPSITCQILQVSRAIYDEATSVYFGRNTFEFLDTYVMYQFLSKLRTDNRRKITSVRTPCSGLDPSLAMKSLRWCVSLRTLSLDFHLRMINFGKLRWDRIPGLTDLLKIRGIETLELRKPTITRTGPAGGDLSRTWPALVKRLQVLKKPYSKDAICRQDKRDYPAEKTKRTVAARA